MRAGDTVEVDAPGQPFHGRWGFVKEVTPLHVLVQLAEFSSLEQRHVLLFPLKFSLRELRMAGPAERAERMISRITGEGWR